MLKKTLNLNGLKTLTKTEQKEIKGGAFGGCPNLFMTCESSSDCPSCAGGCRPFNLDINGQNISFRFCSI